jgi:ribonuclease P protein component
MVHSSKQSEAPSNSQTHNTVVETKSLAESSCDKGLKQFGLSKREKLKSKKEFDLVYSTGEFLISPSQRLKALFLIDRTSGSAGVKTAYAVSRKAGNAVWRNRIKRLLRESYRLNKKPIKETCESKMIHLLLVFSAYGINQRKNKKIFLKEIMPDVVDLMNLIRAKL